MPTVRGGFRTFSTDELRDIQARQPLVQAEVIADMVADRLRAPAPEPDPDFVSTAEAARRLGVDRGTLDLMVSRAPRSLPGGPLHVGEGKARRHLRWPTSTLKEWADAYREFERTRGKKK